MTLRSPCIFWNQRVHLRVKSLLNQSDLALIFLVYLRLLTSTDFKGLNKGGGSQLQGEY